MLTTILLLLFLCSCDGWELWALSSAILFHELGHLAVLCAFDVRVRELRLGETGALIGCGALSSEREEALAAMAGPIGGLLWAAAVYCLPIEHREHFANVSVLMSLFNLLPMPDSDGGRIYLVFGGKEKYLRCFGLVILTALSLLCLFKRLWYSAAVCLRLLYGCVRTNRTPSEAREEWQVPSSPAGKSEPD